ncbi:MAG TPA: GNAT family N-acetyltransferase [Acidimicrobiales bacterium]
MASAVQLFVDPAEALTVAGAFLRSRPVEHNLILTLLLGRVADPVPGRYWIASDGKKVTGVAFQSPLDYPATVTPMGAAAISAVVEAIASASSAIAGVAGEAATAARFAGKWTEVTKSAATPAAGQRLYTLERLHGPGPTAGALRVADDDDLDLLNRWSDEFAADAGGPAIDRSVLTTRVRAGHYWLWYADTPVSMVARTAAVERVVRMQAVYTPRLHRNQGFAAACVGHLSEVITNEGNRCILYTDLANPTPNTIYRRLGYVATSEILRYTFAGDEPR